MNILLASSTDWKNFILAIQAFMLGENPYHVQHFWNPTWALFPLIPFELFPFGRELLFVVSLVSLAFVAKKLGAKPIGMIAFLLSPLVFDALLWGNIEWLTLLGLVMNPLYGIWLLALKPQMTFILIAFILIMNWRKSGLKSTLKIIALPILALLISFALYGFWVIKWFDYSQVTDVNVSFFPYSIILGIILTILAFRRNDLRYALSASLMFFPNLSPTVWLVVPLTFVSSTRFSVLACVAMWTFVFWIR